ncbi:MAG: vancomycin resistance protein YoaR [Myxococcota bacterium]
MLYNLGVLVQRLTSGLLGLLFVGCAVLAPRPAELPVRATAAPAEPNWTLIGGYSTTFDLDQKERSHNIQQAVLALDGATLKPGEHWSFNQAVGPRTHERGYQIAPVLEFEGARPALGGGICQVSTTVYNAALLADLAVKQRHPHSRPVAYVELGRDATVSWGSKDLQMANPHDFPLRFHAHIAGNRLVVRLYGKAPLEYEVRLTIADSEPASPRKEYQTLDDSDRIAVVGVWVKLYRHRLKDGSVYETERVGRSSFYPFRVKERR